MYDPGNQDTNPYEELSTLYAEPADKGPVFPGKPYTPNPYRRNAGGNPAVQRSLMEIFDEFTEVISGELKSMNLEEFNREAQKKSPQ